VISAERVVRESEGGRVEGGGEEEEEEEGRRGGVWGVGGAMAFQSKRGLLLLTAKCIKQ
jgi:hypothetical protein